MKTLTQKNKSGFTLIEVVVASSLFVVLVSALTILLNTTLKINRRGEALRQATQGMRNFVEFLAKEIRNGQIDYWIDNGSSVFASSIGPCNNAAYPTKPSAVGNDSYPVNGKTNKVGIINSNGIRECIYYADASGNPVANTVFSSPSGQKYTIVFEDQNGTKEILTPPNGYVESLVFFVRPICDPYTSNCSSYSNSYPKIQPFVQVSIKFMVTLPTGEQVPLYYQTSISTNKYDIPNS